MFLLDRLLVETDSPYLSPHPFRGQTNEPARVTLTALKLAEIRGLSPAEFAQISTANARHCSGCPRPRPSERAPLDSSNRYEPRNLPNPHNLTLTSLKIYKIVIYSPRRRS